MCIHDCQPAGIPGQYIIETLIVWCAFPRETDRSWDLFTGKSLVLMAVALGGLEGGLSEEDSPSPIWRRSLVKALKLRLEKPENSTDVMFVFLVSAPHVACAIISRCSSPGRVV